MFALQRQQPEKDKRNVDVATPLEKFMRTHMATTLSASFDVWASQFNKLTMYEIEK